MVKNVSCPVFAIVSILSLPSAAPAGTLGGSFKTEYISGSPVSDDPNTCAAGVSGTKASDSQSKKYRRSINVTYVVNNLVELPPTSFTLSYDDLISGSCTYNMPGATPGNGYSVTGSYTVTVTTSTGNGSITDSKTVTQTGTTQQGSTTPKLLEVTYNGTVNVAYSDWNMVNNGDGTYTYKYTPVIWTTDGGCNASAVGSVSPEPDGPPIPYFSGGSNWQENLSYCKLNGKSIFD